MHVVISFGTVGIEHCYSNTVLTMFLRYSIYWHKQLSMVQTHERTKDDRKSWKEQMKISEIWTNLDDNGHVIKKINVMLCETSQ